MDNRRLSPGKTSLRQPLGCDQCIFDDEYGMLDIKIFGILRSAIRRWKMHTILETSNTLKDHQLNQDIQLQDRKSIKFQQEMEKLDNAIRLLREDLKREEQSSHKDDDKHLQAEGDVTIGASSNMEPEVGNKAKQKTDVTLRNEIGAGIGDHLALDIDVKDLSATQVETKVYRMETECLETIPGLSRKLPFQSEKQLQLPHSNTTKYAKFQTKTGVGKEIRRISDQRLEISYKMLPSIPSEMTSQPTRSNIENAKLLDRKTDAGKTETKIYSDQISAMFDDT
eukprot:XP_011674290.1 PREDICTED: uncharacterized protein LOC105443143 [Strongylocentrotus purpuratus]